MATKDLPVVTENGAVTVGREFLRYAQDDSSLIRDTGLCLIGCG